MVRVLVGCDPELFLKEKSTGKLISAHTIVPGTKLEPFKVPHGAVQVDGAAAEFNIDPAESGSVFVNNINVVMTSLKGYTNAKNLELVLKPTVTFEPTYFETLPDTVRELGCNPDFNAWTGEVNPTPDGDRTTMRTASGHIHVGWCKNVNPQDPMHFDDCRVVIKQLDYYLGLYSLMWDTDSKRRQLYGKAGAFRPKPYGVEYRTMSNVWLRSPVVQSWIFIAAVQAVNHLLANNRKSMEDYYGDWARTVIDSGSQEGEPWWATRKGQEMHSRTGLNWPDYKSCLLKTDAPKPSKVVMDAKDKSAKHKYGKMPNVNEIMLEMQQQQAQQNNDILGNAA